jgi:hypothetical protein
MPAIVATDIPGMSGNLPVPPAGLEVLYVDASAAGRAAFVATHGEGLTVHALVAGMDLGGSSVAVVVVRDRGPGTVAQLRGLAGHERIVLADAARAGDVAGWIAQGLAESFVLLPAPPWVMRQVLIGASRAADQARRAEGYLDALVEQDRLATLGAIRGVLLHDLANLTTAATVDVEMLRRTVGVEQTEEVDGLVDTCNRMLQVHLRSRGSATSLRRSPQVHGAAALLAEAAEHWKLTAHGAPALRFTCPAEATLYTDRTDFVRVALALAELAVRGGVPPHLEVTCEPRHLTILAEGAADPHTITFELAARLVAANSGEMTVDDGAVRCRFRTRT